MDFDIQPFLDLVGAHWPWATPLLAVAGYAFRVWLLSRRPEIQYIPNPPREEEAAKAVGAPGPRPQPVKPPDPFGGP